jgi:hypothetical protein
VTSELSPFHRYLASKVTVDDRALNRMVWAEFARAVEAPRRGPLRLLEVGAGIGSMLPRVLEWTRATNVAYTALDQDPTAPEVARRRLQAWCLDHGWSLVATGPEALELTGDGRSLRVSWETADLYGRLAQPGAGGAWHGVVAHAVLDLLDVQTAVPALLHGLGIGGWFYFTLNFDGRTQFLPELDPELDSRIERAYHRTMDLRTVAGGPSGDSRTGSKLYGVLRALGAEVLAWGSSDWAVWPTAGAYPAEEAHFLRHILGTIEAELRSGTQVPREELERWIGVRRAQLERGELAYLAHQLDYFGRVPRGI